MQHNQPRSGGRAAMQFLPLEMLVVITNGDPARDARVKFEFFPDQADTARLWLVKLPQLKNPYAFPRELAPGRWELVLEAVSETQPIHVINYTPASARLWLKDVFHKPPSAPTELLILCHAGRFTITIHQSLV